MCMCICIHTLYIYIHTLYMYMLMYNNTFLILYGDSASASLNISRNFAVMIFPTKSLCDYVSC